MTKREILASLSSEAKARQPLPMSATGDRISIRWPKYSKAKVYEGIPLKDTFDAHAKLRMGDDSKVDTARPHNSVPKPLPTGFYNPSHTGTARLTDGKRPITVAPVAVDSSLYSNRVRSMKPKAKNSPKAKPVLGVVDWDVQYRPDLPADWSEQARKRNWDCISRFLGKGERPTLKTAQRLLTLWRLFDTRIIVDIDDKRRTRDVWFKIPPQSNVPRLGRIADDGISGR